MEWSVGIAFEPFISDACCLCGTAEGLTGEHKVKASALRAIFGREQMVIGRFGDQSGVRSAQGPNSKAFHFRARVCGLCNSTRTQPADREFDKFHRLASDLLEAGHAPELAFNEPRYTFGSEPYLNVFRYFAKQMCCHLAEVRSPRPLQVARFAMGMDQPNPISLGIDEDWAYRRAAAELGPQQYASHGGLTVYAHKTSGDPGGFHSTLTIGAVRYVYFIRLCWLAKLELRLQHREFMRWCRERGLSGEYKLTAEDELRLGFTVEDGSG